YPYLIFYRDQPDHVDVWRVLHAKRDIPQWMQEPNNH
ncbi:type II toxin-antitoxin system RelE/ParE family toxin, partial [Sinorhizobium meliloti]